MNKVYFIIILFLATNLYVFAEAPDWSVNPENFSYNMTFTCVLNIEQIEQTSIDNQIAVFVDDECRGFANCEYIESIDRYVFFMMAYSNSSDETLSFKTYISENDEVVDLINSVTFQVNGIIGDTEIPYILSDVELNNEADFLSFELPNQLNSEISENEINIEMPEGTNITNLVADFTISEFASAYIGIEEQVSGISANDFSSPIVYRIIAENGEMQEWTVNVYLEGANSIPENSELFTIFPNPTTDFINIECDDRIENVKIIDMSGKVLISSNNTKIDISDFQSGVYILIIKTKHNVLYEKIIKN